MSSTQTQGSEVLRPDMIREAIDESTSSTVHPTSIVDPSCKLAKSVEIGPFCVLGPNVEIGENTKLMNHVTVLRNSVIGKGCTIWPNAVLGAPAQVYQDDPSQAALIIGDRVTIRENVTVNLSVMSKDRPTRIGDDCLLMANVHVAHDCQISNNVTLVQGVGLAGHCEIQEGATIGGLAGLHQHVVVGEHSFVGGGAIVTHDVLPYSIVTGNRAKTTGLNVVGLKRKGWTDAKINSLKSVVAEFFRSGEIRSDDEFGNAQRLRAFTENCKRGVCQPVSAVIETEKKTSRL